VQRGRRRRSPALAHPSRRAGLRAGRLEGGALLPAARPRAARTPRQPHPHDPAPQRCSSPPALSADRRWSVRVRAHAPRGLRADPTDAHKSANPHSRGPSIPQACKCVSFGRSKALSRPPFCQNHLLYGCWLVQYSQEEEAPWMALLSLPSIRDHWPQSAHEIKVIVLIRAGYGIWCTIARPVSLSIHPGTTTTLQKGGV